MGKVMGEFCHGTSAVADGVFDVVAQFGKGFVVAFGLENGVVAEALPSPTLFYYRAFYDALEE